MKKEENTIQKEIHFYALFWLFMIGSVIGFCIEGLWSIVRVGHWEHHAATIWGPFCIIYGIGTVAVYVTSYLLRNRNLAVKFLTYFLTGALVEYFGSLFQEICLGSVSWNYSDHFMNIGGRVSLIMALTWGVLGISFMNTLYPVIQKLLVKSCKKPLKMAALALVIFMAINLSLTSFTIMRWRERLENIPAENKMEVWADTTYGNEKMQELFSNMRFTAEETENGEKISN